MSGDKMIDIQKGAFKVNIAQLCALVVNTAVLVWFAATLSAQVNNHTKDIADNKAQIAVQATAVNGLTKDVAEMKGKLDAQGDVLNNINNAVMAMPSRKSKNGG